MVDQGPETGAPGDPRAPYLGWPGNNRYRKGNSVQWVINRSTKGLGTTFVAWVLLVAVIVIGHMPAAAGVTPAFQGC